MCLKQKMQEMDQRRVQHLAEGYCQFSDIEKKVLPIISKCLEGITAAGKNIDEKQVCSRFARCKAPDFSHYAKLRSADGCCLFLIS